MLSPFAATAMTSRGIKFSYFFGVSLGLSFLNFICLYLTFGRDPEHASAAKKSVAQGEAIELQPTGTIENQADPPLSTAAKNRAMLSNKTIWLVAIFLCFYVGSVPSTQC